MRRIASRVARRRTQGGRSVEDAPPIAPGRHAEGAQIGVGQIAEHV